MAATRKLRAKRTLVANRDGWFCWWCRCPLVEHTDAATARVVWSSDGVNLVHREEQMATLDHLDALLVGDGRNHLDNLVLACHLCNVRRGQEPWTFSRIDR